MILIILVVFWVVAYIYFHFKSKPDFPHFVPVMIIIGSGGHTTEMLSYVSSLTKKYQPRTYVIAKTDALSEEKVLNCETRRGILFNIKRIHRAREVRQSFMSSILSVSVSFLHSLPLVVQCRPKLLDSTLYFWYKYGIFSVDIGSPNFTGRASPAEDYLTGTMVDLFLCIML
uniref:UDP-N-acetylglucosamine transferase subunit ALG14 n=1 Tax=Trichobilharzia regenti TaxID=157069 RepID=A0AA85JYV4_TRIRE|nr:unnamed protein product [Trichobilharzia regenti]